jgi:hypothetical protein
MHRASRLTATAFAVAAMIAALPATAVAKAQLPASAVPWVAQYSLQVSGSQHGSWTEHHAAQPPCDGGETGSGFQDVTLTPAGGTTVFASGVGPTLTSLIIAAAADVPVPGDPNSVPQTLLQAHAAVNRYGSVTDGQPSDPTQCPSGDGGGTTPPQPDCGTKSQLLKLWFSQGTNLLQFEQPDGSVGGDPFTDCPYIGSNAFPTWSPVYVALPLSGWGPAPPIGTARGIGLPVELEGQATSQQHDADVDGSTNEHLTLRFTPIYVAPTIILGNVSSERVNSDGAIGVPVTCPTGEKSGCSGTVSLAIDVAAASSGAARAVARTPGSFVAVAKSAFKLRAGTHQRVAIRIAHSSKTYLRSLAQAPLVIAVTVGQKHKLRYVAAKTRLRI